MGRYRRFSSFQNPASVGPEEGSVGLTEDAGLGAAPEDSATATPATKMGAHRLRIRPGLKKRVRPMPKQLTSPEQDVSYGLVESPQGRSDVVLEWQFSDLGPIRCTMASLPHGLHIRFWAESEHTKSLLEHKIPGLLVALEGKGKKISAISVALIQDEDLSSL